MFAIIETGGKQYKIKENQIFFIERLPFSAGESVTMEKVLMVHNDNGEISHNAGKVVVEILENRRDDKIVVFKKQRRKNHRRKQGHRQNISVVKVKQILV